MLRRKNVVRTGLFAIAVALGSSAVPRTAQADDDVISLAAFPPELIQALTGSTMSPDVLAALLAATGGSRAAQQGMVPGMPMGASIPARPNSNGANAVADPAHMLSGLMDSLGGDSAGGTMTAAPATGSGGVVDVHHPGDPQPASTGPRPERIRSGGRSSGIVELHPSTDDASTVAVGGASDATTLPTVRIARPRSRATRPPRATPTRRR